MPRARRVCLHNGCPRIVPGRYCPEHAADAELARGTTTARGYGASHQRARALWAQRIAAQGAACTRCGGPIPRDAPAESWHLDHDDDDRTRYRGPSHAMCNTAAGGRRGGASSM